MGQTIFDICSGTIDKDAAWIEVAEGLSSACQRMEKIATDSPGQYFVLDPKSRSVVARIDNRKVLPWPAAKAKSA